MLVVALRRTFWAACSLKGATNSPKRKVKAGDRVLRGQTIGKVGNTGKSTASHLHYEIKKFGKNINPKDYYYDVPIGTFNSLCNFPISAGGGIRCLDDANKLIFSGCDKIISNIILFKKPLKRAFIYT